MQRRWIVLFVLAAMVLSACGAAAEKIVETATEKALESEGGGDVNVDLNDDGSVNISVEGEDGQSINIGSDVPLPEGLSFPVVDGGKATHSASDDSYVSVAIVYPLDRFDELRAFYDDWTSNQSEDWSRSESTFDMGDAGTQRSVTWSAGSSAILLNQCFTFESEGDTFDAACVSISESK